MTEFCTRLNRGQAIWASLQKIWKSHRIPISTKIHHEETRELPGERDNARNNDRCTQARNATHGLDGQQDVDRTLRGRVSQNDRGQA